MKYYVIVQDMRTGPFTLDEVKRQHLTPDTLVWHKGMPDWKEACTFPVSVHVQRFRLQHLCRALYDG